MVLTFPSPQDQRYHRAEKPEELQVIDEVIELSDLLALADETGLSLRHFSLEDVWLKNQYAHCVLQTSIELRPLPIPKLSLISKVRGRLRRALETRLLVPFRRHRFVNRIFGNMPPPWSGS